MIQMIFSHLKFEDLKNLRQTHSYMNFVTSPIFHKNSLFLIPICKEKLTNTNHRSLKYILQNFPIQNVCHRYCYQHPHCNIHIEENKEMLKLRKVLNIFDDMEHLRSVQVTNMSSLLTAIRNIYKLREIKLTDLKPIRRKENWCYAYVKTVDKIIEESKFKKSTVTKMVLQFWEHDLYDTFLFSRMGHSLFKILGESLESLEINAFNRKNYRKWIYWLNHIQLKKLITLKLGGVPTRVGQYIMSRHKNIYGNVNECYLTKNLRNLELEMDNRLGASITLDASKMDSLEVKI